MTVQFVLVNVGCTGRHQTVVQNVQSTKIAHQIEHVFHKNVKIHVLVHAALMQSVTFKIIAQFVNVLKVMKEIHTQVAM
jgi:hypothetical protein